MAVAAKYARLGLAKRAMVLVTVALLPLGVIGVWQTDRILKKDAAMARDALLAITDRAAARDRQRIERAIGAAATMADAAYLLRDDPQGCARLLRQVAGSSPAHDAAAFVPADGRAACASSPDASIEPLSRDMEAETDPAPRIDIETHGGAAPRLVVATPVFDGDRLAGHLRLRLAPRTDDDPLDGMAASERPQGLVTFNAAGRILTPDAALDPSGGALPAGLPLSSLTGGGDYTFAATAEDGQERLYAVVALVPEVAYTLGIWDPRTPILPRAGPYWRTIALAVLMWAVTLVTVYLIMRLEVIDGVRALHREIRSFRATRRLPRGAAIGRGELLALEENFRDLARTVLREEAELENALHAKNVLLMEVHHRVKNNLQLIGSILNMLQRRAQSDETRQVVARLQDRVLALAAVHRAVYGARSVDRIDAAEILRDIVTRATTTAAAGAGARSLRLDLAPAPLRPDQVLPLALFVSEAMANALADPAPDPRISVTLAFDPDRAGAAQRSLRLRVAHDVGDPAPEDDATSFSRSLMQAFAHQLDGTLGVSREDGRQVVDVSFKVDSGACLPSPTDSVLAAQ